MAWTFEPTDPMGGAAGEAFASTLTAAGMPTEHVLAREAIQNSVDASAEGARGGKVRVVFRNSELTGAAKARFVEAAGLAEIGGRASVLSLGNPNCLSTLESSRPALSLLYIEDYGTVGLSGDPHDDKSNFFRLLLSLGDRSKARGDRGSGGSYGFGKSAYSAASAIQTIFAFTRFQDGGGERLRLFGAGYFASHSDRGGRFTGRAWFGDPRSAKDGRLVVDPLEGQDAGKAAAALGFAERKAGDIGTTLLIVDAAADPQKILEGTEVWWWPRLVENRLDVEIVDQDGDVKTPRPKGRADLRPFIEAFEIATRCSEPHGRSQKRQIFNRLEQAEMGVCGLVVPELAEGSEDSVVGTGRENTVALIRDLRMVVAYQDCGRGRPAVVGAYVSPRDGEVDNALRASEPPMHDRWDPESQNLRDESGRRQRLVGGIVSRTRAALKRFQGEAAPPPTATGKRLSALERRLAAYLKPMGEGSSPRPPAGETPIHLDFTRQPAAEAVGQMLRMRAAFSVWLDSEAPEDALNVFLRIACPVLEDDDAEGEELTLKVEHDGVAANSDPSDKRCFEFCLAKGERARFRVTSEPYDPSWTVRLRPEIEASETE